VGPSLGRLRDSEERRRRVEPLLRRVAIALADGPAPPAVSDEEAVAECENRPGATPDENVRPADR
jgi:hypothetical protein